jgi:hypothetical protein
MYLSRSQPTRGGPRFGGFGMGLTTGPRKNSLLRNVNWIHLTKDMDEWRAPVDTVMNHRVPQNAGNVLRGSATVSFIRRTQFRGLSLIVH